MVHAPAAVPRAVRRLIALQKGHAALHDRVRGGPTEAAQTLDDTRRYVGGRGIDHGVVIREGHLREDATIVVTIECAPAAIAVLHAQQPSESAPQGSLHAR